MRESKDLSKEISNATKWSVITNIVRKLITPITNMVLARLLAPDAFGVVASINMVISFAEMFSDAGFQKYLVQHEFDDESGLFKAANVAFWTNLSISLFLWVGIAIFRFPIAELVGSQGYETHLVVAALSIPLVSFSSIQQALYRRSFDFKGLFFPRLMNSLIPVIVTIPLAFFTRNCWALIMGTLISNLTDAVLLTVKSKWKPSLWYSLRELKKMLSFSIWTIFESCSIWLTINVDIFLLGRVLSSYHLGLYKTSITSVDQISTLITTTIIPVLFAGLSRYQNNPVKYRETFYSFQRICAIILIPMSIGIFLYSDVVTWFLLGSQWMEAQTFIGLIGLMQAFTVLYANFASEVYRSMGEPRVSFVVQMLYIICIIWGVNLGARREFEELCFIRALLMIAFVVIHLFVLVTRYHMNLGTMIKNIASPLLASLVMALVGWFVREQVTAMMARFLSIFLCAIVYFGVCLLFADTRNTIIAFAKKLKRK